MSSFAEPSPLLLSVLAGVTESLHHLAGPALKVTSVSQTETVLAPGWGEPSGQPPTFLVQADVDGREFAFHVHEGSSAAEQLWRCAQALVDAAQEALGSAPYPPCPGHRHPMVVERDGDQVYWCCPTTRNQPAAPIALGR